MALGTPTNLTSGGAATAAASRTTASISPTGGALLLACTGATRGSAAPTTVVVTDTLTGTGTWTSINLRDASGKVLTSLSYAKAGPTPGTGTITFTYSGGSNPVRQAWIVDEITGQDTTTPVPESATNEGTGTTLTVNLASIASGNKAYGVVNNGAGTGITAGSGETEIFEVSSTGTSNVLLQTEYGTTTGVDWSTLITTLASVGIAIEIAEATATIRRVMVVS